MHGSATAGLLSWAWAMRRNSPIWDIRVAAAVFVAAGLFLTDLLPLSLGMACGGPHLYTAPFGWALTVLR